MSEIAEDLIGVPLAFALAQKPHLLATGGHIATLAPLMNLRTGALLNPDQRHFPDRGYVFWWDVPPGSWNPGDIVVGTLDQSLRYHDPEQDWYQVHSSRGHAVQGEVFEAVKVFGRPSGTFRWLVDGSFQLSCATRPSPVFYVWTETDLIGPFHAADVKGERDRFTYVCKPTDVSGGVVMRYPNAMIEVDAEQWRSKQAVTVSLNDTSPNRGNSVDVNRTYCLIRREELEAWRSMAIELSLLPDQLVISKACKRISGRRKQRELRSQLELLLQRLREEDAAMDNAIEDGLSEILSKARLSESMADQIVESLLQGGEFDERINSAVSSRVDRVLMEKTQEIEEQARSAAASQTEEVKKLQEQITGLTKEREHAEGALRKAKEERAVVERQSESIISSVNERLESGRKSLLGDLALLGPIFQGNGHAPRAYRAASESAVRSAPPSGRRPENGMAQGGAATVSSPQLSELNFIRHRLWPCLVRHGCAVDERAAEFFHVAVLSGRLLGLPHPGWAVGYVDAMGGTASVTTVTVTPKWLDFDHSFGGELANAWRRGVEDPDHLQIIVLEGIDRAPSHAWLRPWISILAGWSRSLPGDKYLKWPENIRLCVTEERSAECFDLSDELRGWILAFKGSDLVETPAPAPPHDGHFPLQSWLLPPSPVSDDGRKGLIESLEMPMGEAYSKARIELAFRLKKALIRLTPNDSDRIEIMIRRKFFSCWAKDAHE
ncbi:hypothetical protein GYB59_21315 [bacterium]|nr:hypothetical protein [bacterium]